MHLKKTQACIFSISLFAVCFVAKEYILQQKCLNRQIGTCLLGTCGSTFSPVDQPWEPQCTASETDGRTDDRIKPVANHTVYHYDGLIKTVTQWFPSISTAQLTDMLNTIQIDSVSQTVFSQKIRPFDSTMMLEPVCKVCQLLTVYTLYAGIIHLALFHNSVRVTSRAHVVSIVGVLSQSLISIIYAVKS